MIYLNLEKKNEIEEAFTALQLLELSIGVCLASTINEVIERGDAQRVEVRISADKVRITITCKKEVEEKIEKAIGDCFVLQHLNFERLVSFEPRNKS